MTQDTLTLDESIGVVGDVIDSAKIYAAWCYIITQARLAQKYKADAEAYQQLLKHPEAAMLGGMICVGTRQALEEK